MRAWRAGRSDMARRYAQQDIKTGLYLDREAEDDPSVVGRWIEYDPSVPPKQRPFPHRRPTVFSEHEIRSFWADAGQWTAGLEEYGAASLVLSGFDVISSVEGPVYRYVDVGEHIDLWAEDQ